MKSFSWLTQIELALVNLIFFVIKMLFDSHNINSFQFYKIKHISINRQFKPLYKIILLLRYENKLHESMCFVHSSPKRFEFWSIRVRIESSCNMGHPLLLLLRLLGYAHGLFTWNSVNFLIYEVKANVWINQSISLSISNCSNWPWRPF